MGKYQREFLLSEACRILIVNEVVRRDLENKTSTSVLGKGGQRKTIFSHPKIAGLLLQEKDKTEAD